MKIHVRSTLFWLLTACSICECNKSKQKGRWTDTVDATQPSPITGKLPRGIPPKIALSPTTKQNKTALTKYQEALKRKNNRNPLNIRFRGDPKALEAVKKSLHRTIKHVIKNKDIPPTRTRGSKAGHVLTGRNGILSMTTKRGRRRGRLTQKSKVKKTAGASSNCPASCPPPWAELVAKMRGDILSSSDPICDFASMFIPCSAPGSVCRRDPVMFTCCPKACMFSRSSCSFGNNTSGNVCLPITLQPWIKELMPVLSLLKSKT